jgi:hypothetical protein
MAGWGSNTFGYLKWGEFGNAYVNVTNPNDTYWGKDAYGNFYWGGGGNLDASIGEPTVTAEVNVGWSAKEWGYANWGDLFNANVTPTGNQITSNVGSVTIDAEINTGWGRVTWGYNGWGIEGTLQVEGISLSSNLGSVIVNNEINTGWGSDTWGFETWGISGQNADVTGIELSANTGSVIINADGATGELTGEPMTAVVDDVEAFASFVAEPTGMPMTMTLQYQEAIVDPTGQELTANDGTADLDANTIVEVSATSAVTWGNSAWGYGVYGNQQVDTLTMGMQEGEVDPAPDANLTGIAMAAVLDDVITQGDANTGTITPIKWGEQTWGQSTWGNGDYFDATGYAQAATINLGTAVLDANTIAEVSGQEMTMQEGDETTSGNAVVLVSGNALTMATGSLKTLIWNQVNTGTAPVVPPGWQEVDTAA